MSSSMFILMTGPPVTCHQLHTHIPDNVEFALESGNSASVRSAVPSLRFVEGGEERR